MITVHEGNKTYKVGLRGSYSHIKSEKAFRDLVERGIVQWETRSPEYGKALRSKSIFEVCRIFGIVSKKVQVK
jgi:hypothetical protein